MAKQEFKRTQWHIVWYLEKESRSDSEIWSIDRVSYQENFYGKSMQVCIKFLPKASPRPRFNLVNNPKQPVHVSNFFENNIF